jgi:hypothetical protein
MEILLDAKELHTIIYGTWRETNVKSQEEKILWKRCDNATRMLINTSVDETHLQMLINCQTFEHMWSRLIVVHKQSSRENVHLLQGKFLSYKM